MAEIVENENIVVLAESLYQDLSKLYPSDQLVRLNDYLKEISNGNTIRSSNSLQYPDFYYPGVNTTPWYDKTRYSAVDLLESHYPSIKEELLSVLEAKRGFQPFAGTEGERENYIKGDMNIFYLKDDFTKNLSKLEANRLLCPKTASIIDQLPRGGQIAFFSALNPGTELAPHCGAENLRTIIHLGLIIPDKCYLTVSGHSKTWCEGECLVFDDSFEHSACNLSDKTRFILLLDIWHPELTDAEIEFFKTIGKMVNATPEPEETLNKTVSLENKKWWV